MKKLSIILFLFFIACGNKGQEQKSSENPAAVSDQPSSELLIGAFNIRVFGQSKVSDKDVMDLLVKIVSRYDLILIQEIRDSSSSAIYDLFDKVQKNSGDSMEIVLGDRQGRSVSKEQYAFIFKKALFSAQKSFSYPDASDKFERPPLLVSFSLIGTDIKFTGIGIHVKPDDAFNEISYLPKVYEYSSKETSNESSLILGDLNSDCSYLSSEEYEKIRAIHTDSWSWLIDRTIDTTTTPTDCNYDQIIATGAIKDYIIDKSGNVFNFKEAYKLTDEQALEISDHYPVEIKLAKKGIDPQTLPPSKVEKGNKESEPKEDNNDQDLNCEKTMKSYQGCCSAQGGFASLCSKSGYAKFDANGYLMCKDGSSSPSCNKN